MENQTNLTENPVPTPQTANQSGGTRNFVIAIVALILGAVIVSAVFIMAYPQDEKVTEEPVSNEITTEAQLDKVAQELDGADLDSLEKDLDQNDVDSADF